MSRGKLLLAALAAVSALHRTDEAKLGERRDSPWRQGKRSKLRRGDRWSRAGVSCVRKKVLRCANRDRARLHPHTHRFQAVLGRA